MIFPGWQIGLDIQTEAVRAVAVQRHRQGWQLRHWWYLPFSAGAFVDNTLSQPALLCEVLDNWRKQLPSRYRLSVSFPTQHTFQQKIPLLGETLCEAVYEDYVAYTTAQQLQIPASQLCCDYIEQDSVLNVTAARQSDLNTLLSCLKSAQLRPNTVTPCDQVLHTLPAECYPKVCHYLIHEESGYWLWASCHGKGASGWLDKQQFPDLAALCLWLNTAIEQVAVSRACIAEKPPSSEHELDAWQPLTRLYPPIPQEKGRYTIALGLALGATS